MSEETHYCGWYTRKTRNDNRLSQAAYENIMARFRMDCDSHVTDSFGDHLDGKSV